MMTMPAANRSTNHLPVPLPLLLMITVATVGAFLGGHLTITPGLTAAISAALLIFGLPHGAFDIALIRRAAGRAPGSGATLLMVAAYLAAAGLTYLTWRAAPGLALAGFLAIAMMHFAEDWRACGSRFVAGGIAAAIVCAPALLHREILADLFVLLTGDFRAGLLAELLLLLAPTAVAIAAVGAVMLVQAGERPLAIALLCAVAAMSLLPPVAGFAVFFCLVHSPAQFRDHASALGLNGFRQWSGEVVPLTLGGLGIAAAVFLFNGDIAMTDNLFATSFMTLAILTVPHMTIPALAGRLRRRHGLARV